VPLPFSNISLLKAFALLGGIREVHSALRVTGYYILSGEALLASAAYVVHAFQLPDRAIRPLLNWRPILPASQTATRARLRWHRPVKCVSCENQLNS
jgi:hypothetical protein